MARIIMCGSFKGGVGKTASSWNLAYSLAEMGKRVLAVDFDSQANLTTCFGIEDPAAVPVTIGHLMMNRLEDEEVPDPSIPDNPEDWLDEFNTFSIYQVLPKLIELWGMNIRTDVEAKKNFMQQTVK